MRVIFTPRAEHQPDALYGRIAYDAGESRAGMSVSRLLDYCEGLTMLPLRGAARDDVLPGLRVTAFERRVTIAYLVPADSLLIEDLDPFRTPEARLGIADVATTGPAASRPPAEPPPASGSPNHPHSGSLPPAPVLQHPPPQPRGNVARI